MKFDIKEKCVDCDSPLIISNLVGNQVNFICSGDSCNQHGLIVGGKLYSTFDGQKDKDLEDKIDDDFVGLLKEIECSPSEIDIFSAMEKIAKRLELLISKL
jgi:hypothetical protein